MYSWPAPPVRHLAACQPVGMIHRVLISLWPVAPYVPHTQWLSQPACSWNVLWQVVGRLWICLPQLRVSPPAATLDSYILTRRDPSIGQCPQTGRGGEGRGGPQGTDDSQVPGIHKGYQEAEGTLRWEQPFPAHYKSCMPPPPPPGRWSVRITNLDPNVATEPIGGLCNETLQKKKIDK